ncbi:hypothetical protein PGQ11_005612 [Apiospora arundinis]|uniref:Secreted protein n=1 Tax=Apiospora arundinis TaxID=335852 RepID=A0ABR2JBB4_9PEZI
MRGLFSLALGLRLLVVLDVLARLGHDVARLGAADGQVLLDEAVAPHHHVDGPAEEAHEVHEDGALGAAGEGDVDGPEGLAGDAEGVDAQGGGDVAEGAVGLALAAVLVEGDGVVERVADLGQQLELGVGRPDGVEVVAGQRRRHGEARQGVAVAHPEPDARRRGEPVDVAPEQLAVALLAGLLRRHEQERLVLAGHQLVAWGALEQLV